MNEEELKKTEEDVGYQLFNRLMMRAESMIEKWQVTEVNWYSCKSEQGLDAPYAKIILDQDQEGTEVSACKECGCGPKVHLTEEALKKMERLPAEMKRGLMLSVAHIAVTDMIEQLIDGQEEELEEGPATCIAEELEELEPLAKLSLMWLFELCQKEGEALKVTIKGRHA